MRRENVVPFVRTMTRVMQVLLYGMSVSKIDAAATEQLLSYMDFRSWTHPRSSSNGVVTEQFLSSSY